MNLRLSILLVAILVLFGGTFLVLRFAGQQEASTDEPWLFRLDDGAIAFIVATHEDKTVNYEKKPGSLKWFILEDPELPVNFEKWSGTPLLLSGPRVNRVLADTIEDAASFGLDPPVSSVTVTERTGIGFEFHMGNITPDESNTYARLVGFPQLFTVPTSWAEVINGLATEPPYPRLYLIDEEDIRDIQVISDGLTVDYHRDPASGFFIIEGDPIVLVSQERWDGTMSLILNPRVVEVLFDKDDLAVYGLDPPVTITRLTRMDGSLIEFHLGARTPDQERYYAQTLGNDEIMIVPAAWAQAMIELATDPPYPAEEEAMAGPG